MEFLNEEEIKDIVNEQVEPPKKEEDLESDIEGDLDDWEEDDVIEIKSLFNSDVLGSVDELIAHDLDMFSFDLKEIAQRLCTDDISIIKLINFIRSKVAEATEASVSNEFVIKLSESIENKEFLEGDNYMRPVLEDDQLLFLYEESLLPGMVDETD